MPELDLTRDDERSRYEGRLDGQLVSLAIFELRDHTMIITHTRTKRQWREHGFAAQVTKFALDDARQRGLRVVPQCWFTADFIDQHPEYAGLLTD